MTPPTSSLSPELLDAAVELMGKSGRGGTVRVQGSSMLPTLREGWLLAVEFSPARISPGDMLVFRRDSLLVVHRLLGHRLRPGTDPSLRTRGDGLPHFDPPVSRAGVVGRVIAVDDGRGWRTLRSPAARAYGKLVAGHDFLWALVTVVAHRSACGFARLGLELPLRQCVAACDRTLLRTLHVLVFRALHRRVPLHLERDAG